LSARRPWLLPLTPLYAAGLAMKRQSVGMGWLGHKQLRNPVISVGSVSAGGAGKTPVVLMLAEMLERGGFAVKILTRGYGRRSKGVERVAATGDPRWFGDEPVLLAQRAEGMGAEVFVAAERYEAGLLAESSPEEGTHIVHVLDDGFQHGRLARDIDVVLLTKQDLEDKLLPAGDLREPLTALRQADVIVLREEELASTAEFARKMSTEGERKASVWILRRRLMLTGKDVLPKRPLVFSGIARPEGFVAMVAAERCEVAATVSFGDHHAYSEQDIERLVKRAQASGADGFVTTEKDAVKLTGALRLRLEQIGPLVALRLHVELVDYKARMTELIGMVAGMDRRGDRAPKRGRRV
jgi:tetraacyldisaccharide 4'-kinase